MPILRPVVVSWMNYKRGYQTGHFVDFTAFYDIIITIVIFPLYYMMYDTLVTNG